MTEVVFVGGAMRSGTTLLGTVLGAAPSVLNAGEVSQVWRQVAAGGACSCGAPLTSCHVWGPSLRVAGIDTWHLRDAEALAEQSTDLFRLRQLPRYGRHVDQGALPEDRRLRRFVRATQAVLDEARERAGASVLVDTSKRVSWLQFHRLADAQTQTALVHLVRDPRGVVASFTREPRDEAWTRDVNTPRTTGATEATVDWLLSNTTTTIGTRWAQRSCTVLYEDLVGDAPTTLRRISRRLDVPVAQSILTTGVVPEHETHVVAGNPGRLQRGPRRLVADQRWRSELSLQRRCAVSAATAPLRVALTRRAR